MSRKFSEDGKYLPFHGYTVVSMCVINDSLSYIEQFIKSSLLSKYYSALPVESYHMTIYNIWAHGQKFLPFQDKWYKHELAKRKLIDVNQAEVWRLNLINVLKGPESTYWGWPDDLMNNKMLHAHKLCVDKNFNYSEKTEYKVKGEITCHGTLQIRITHTEKKEELSELRNNFTKLFGNNDEKLKYHITLAYQYKQIPESDFEECQRLCTELNTHINNVYITLRTPLPVWFNSMERYMNWYHLNGTNNIFYEDL